MKSIYILSIIVFSYCNAKPGDTHTKQLINEQATKSEKNNDYNKTGNQKIINLKSYGAKGLGISSIKEDTTALRNAIADLNKNGGGKLYVPDPPKFYAFAGNGVFVGNNIEIYGDGKGKSEIRNVSPLSGSFLKGPIFLFSTYGPVNEVGIFQNGVDQYAIQDAKKNDLFVTLKNSGDAYNLKNGEVVILGAGKFTHGEDQSKYRFHFMEQNEISNIQNGKVIFKYPITVPLATDNNDAPVILNINNTSSKNVRLGIQNGTSKNVYIHDLTLTQAQTDELNNNASLSTQLNSGGLSGVWQPGGVFEGRFENLKISSYGGFDGNMYTHCNFNHIDIQASKTLFDFGYGSSSDTVHDINWSYLNSPASNFATGFIICNDGTHNILMYNINASGDWNGESIMALNQVKNITFHDIVFNFPNYRKRKNLIQIGDKEAIYSRDINIYNLKIAVDSASSFLWMKGNDAITDPNRNINISGASFKGNIYVQQEATSLKSFWPRKNINGGGKKADKGQSLMVQNINGLSLSDINISSGGLYIEKCNNSTIQKIEAPSSIMTVTNSKNGIKFNQVTVQGKVTN